MALNGTVTGSVTNGSKTFSFYYTWSATQDIANNCSYVTVKTYWSTSNRAATFDTVSARNASITINGTTTSISKRMNCNPWPSDAKYLIQTVSNFQVNHDVDGTKSIVISARANGTAASYGPSNSTSPSGDCTASATITLDTIPRGANVSQTLGSRTETTLTINWVADAVVDRLWYSTDNGSTYTQVTIADSTSGTYTITGLSANTTYQIKTRTRRKNTQVTADSSALSCKTYNWPNGSTMPDFVIGAGITVGIYNPLSQTASVRLLDASNNILATASTSGTSVVFDTSTIADDLYSAIPNSTSGTYKIRCVTDGHTVTKTGGTFSVNPAVCAPEITAAAYKDIKASVVSLTGNNQDIVQNHSQVQYTATGLTAKKSASIVSCSVLVNGQTVNLTVSGTSASGGNAVINSGSDVSAVFTVTDSRGLTGTKTITVNMLAWSVPSAIITLQRQDNYSTNTDLTVDALFASINGNNQITITYAATKAGDLSPSVSGSLQDNVTATIALDNGYAWSVKITLTDSLGGTTNYTKSVAKVIPIVFVDELRESVGINQFPTHDGTLEIAGNLYINSKLVKAWVVDSGTTDGWQWKKFSDGTFEAWGIFDFKPTSSTANGNIYYSNTRTISLPFTAVSGIAIGAGNTELVWVANTEVTASSTVTFRIVKGGSISTSTTYKIRLYVTGTY